jgi:hypothetical protein
MFTKKQSRDESEEMNGGRIKVGKLQRIREAFSELTPGEQKKVKGGVVISIIGILVGGRSAPADQTNRS